MVKVYQPGQVREAALADTRTRNFATADQFGAREGRQLAQVGSKIASDAFKVAMASQAKLSEAKVSDRLFKARKEAREKMNEVYSLKGEEAANSLKIANEYFTKEGREKFTKDLSETEKAAFERQYNALANSHLDRVITHQTREIDRFNIQTKEADSADRIEDAITYRSEPQKIQENENAVLANAEFIGKQKGLSGKALEKYKEDTVHNFHTQILEAIKGDSMKAAYGYFKENKDKFNPTVRAKLGKDLEEKARTENAMDTAKDLMASGANLEYVNKQLSKIKDPEEQKLATKFFRDMQDQKDKIKQLEAKQKYENEVDNVFKDPLNYDLKSKDFLSLPAAEQTKVYNLRKALTNDHYASKGVGRRKHTDMAVYAKLKALPQDRLLDETMANIDKLSEADAKKFIDAATKKEKYDSVQSLASFVNASAKEMDLSEEEKGIYLKTFEEELNKYPPEEREKAEIRNKVKDLLFTEVDVKGSFFDKKYYEAVSQGDEIEAPDNIPSEVPSGAKWTSRQTKKGPAYGWVFDNDKGDPVFYDYHTGKMILGKRKKVANGNAAGRDNLGGQLSYNN